MGFIKMLAQTVTTLLTAFAGVAHASPLVSAERAEIPGMPGVFLDYTCLASAVTHLSPELQLVSTGNLRPEARSVLLSGGQLIPLSQSGQGGGVLYFVDSSGNQQVSAQITAYAGKEFSAVVLIGRFAATEYLCRPGSGR